MSKKKTYISLFSSAGVGCYGFKMNDFDCIATNELLDVRLNVQKANHKCKYGSGYIGGDITSKETHAKLFDEIEMWKGKEGLEQVDVVFATPPCQGMSTANYKKTEDEQVRNSLVVQAIKLISQIQPKIFIFENVRAFMKTICTDTDGTDKPISESIFCNLADRYNIFYRVINFKDYGVPSSRPRTIVIGTSKECPNLSPLSLFPSRHREIKLREAIGDLASLGYCQKDVSDYLHFARPFPKEQLSWIINIKEGQSAFDQPVELQPGHIDEHGNKVVNKGAYMGNKYRRLVWDKVCSCIHTRNDVLSSQDTIHPVDNRVLSIRELMRVMTIPSSFHWTDYDDSVTMENADEYLKANELNIRRCIGEAVPTQIMRNVASKIKLALEMGDKNQEDFFINVKELEVKGESVRIKAKDANTLLDYLPQIVGLLSDKTKLEIHCIDFLTTEIESIKEKAIMWDLADYVKIVDASSKQQSQNNYQLLLADGKLSTYNAIQQLSFFD
ncbi:DNA cytosine methyltransferase [Prevotella amnii]|uniref:DNA cytosine methyltransferase n=1 Tax=Prevotella amnii TaxID=419005 RepID=UPI000371FF03|nr:DNA cytosine methyltransferase [Prevotella amnii]